ncbi:MAG: hypothetical protein ACK5MJ_07135 [Alphaproteobacteria bacterium]
MDYIKIMELPSHQRAVLKAQKAWAALAMVAIREEKLTYQQLGEIIHHPHRRLMPIITYIGRFCHIHHLPYLPVICVRKDTGWPGGGFENPQKDTEAVYLFAWEEYPTPSIEMLLDAYKRYEVL